MKKYFSELIGTFGLVFAGCGAIIINDMSGGAITSLGVGLVFGLIIMTMIDTFGDISGAHFNPAVSFGFWLARRLPGKDVFPYILSQCLGAILASLLLKYFFPQHKTLGITLPHLVSLRNAFILESILTFFLMLVVIRVSQGSKEKGLLAALAIGGMVALEAIFAGPITGASMNPARSLGPAMVSGNINSLWIYLTAPFLGAALGVGASFLISEK